MRWNLLYSPSMPPPERMGNYGDFLSSAPFSTSPQRDEGEELADGGINYWNQTNGGGGEEQQQQEGYLFQQRNLTLSNGLHLLPHHQEEEDEGTADLVGEPPPYREPPALGKISGPQASFYDLPNSVPDSTTYQTHSTKFPIVREVVFKKDSQDLAKIPTLSQYHKIQNRKLTKQIAWTDERKAFTLDSRTAKDFQERLLFPTGGSSSLPRRNSLDLEKFVKTFNEEDSGVMASMQSVRMNNLEGVDNGGLDLGPPQHAHSHSNSGLYSSSNKMYFPDSSNSQSLSSSNADSMDTVIYKGHGASAAAQGSPSIRDWQRSMDSNLDRQYGENNGNSNGYREASNNLFLDSRSHHQMQQATSYQPLQFNGPGGGGGMNGGAQQSQFSMEYHHRNASQVQQQHHQQQHLSVQSIPGSQANGNLRAGNGMSGNPVNGQSNGGISLTKSYGSNPQLSAKSPLLTHKQLSPVPPTPHPSDHLLEIKTANNNNNNNNSSKLFHTKTYNHIKDMISSRFGGAVNSGSANSSGKVVNGLTASDKLNNSNSMNSYNSEVNYHSQNAANYGQQQGVGGGSGAMGGQYGGGAGAYYSTSPPTQSPTYTVGLANGTLHHHHPPGHHGMLNGNGPPPSQPPPPASYRSPPMNDRKNVNTSFRKAIQKSTQKSNLTEESVPQMRPIQESSATSGAPAAGRDSYRYNNPVEQQQLGTPMGIHVERAQRALDKLCEGSSSAPPPGSPATQFQRTGSGPILHPHSHQQQQFRLSQQQQQQQQQQQELHHHQRHKFNTKTGLGSPSNPLTVHENSHSVSYSKGHTNEAFTNNDEYNDPPPPLPTSQHPGQQQKQQQQQQQQKDSMNTVGLPTILVEKRENGDGSSGSVETKGTEPSLRNEQLNQITAELQNLAMSVGEQQSSSSECEKGSQRVGSGQSHTTTDSGHGTVLLAKSPLHSSDPSEPADSQRPKFGENVADSISSGNDSEWVDIVEPEIRQILEIERAGKDGVKVKNANGQVKQMPSGQNGQGVAGHGYQNGRSSQQEDSLSPTSPSKKSPMLSPQAPKNFDLNYGKKQSDPTPGTSQQVATTSKKQSPRLPTKVHRSNSNSGSQQRLNAWSSRQRLSNDKGKSSSRKDLSQLKAAKLSRHAMSQILYSLQDDNGDITSTTTGLDLESMLDGPTECTSDDDDLSTTIDTTDAHAIRRQLESLETMYTEVLKVLGARKFGGNRYPSSDLRNAKRRPYGSMSSLPSSVSSRPFREKKKVDDRKKVKDLKTINRRFQRLEAHVVTLARSVAHLSSEMRTQHLMVQEMESIRNEMTQLRSQVVKASMQQSHANGGPGFARASNGRNGAMPNVNHADWSSFRNALPSLTNPSRVRKLTKFFGDEPPLIRIFLKKLGYEKYASAFEQERIGIMELPYLTEERLNKMGIPMGPRLRILQEAHMCLKPHHHDGHQSHHHPGGGGNLSVYVV